MPLSEFTGLSQRLLKVLLQCHNNNVAVINLTADSFLLNKENCYLVDFYSRAQSINDSKVDLLQDCDSLIADVQVNYVDAAILECSFSPELRDAAVGEGEES